MATRGLAYRLPAAGRKNPLAPVFRGQGFQVTPLEMGADDLERPLNPVNEELDRIDEPVNNLGGTVKHVVLPSVDRCTATDSTEGGHLRQ